MSCDTLQLNDNIKPNSYSSLRAWIIKIAYIALCIRGCLSWLGIETQFLTLLLNVLIVLSIDYRKITKTYYYIAPFVLILPFNTGALALIDLFLMALLLKSYSIERLASMYLGVLLCLLFGWIYFYNLGVLNTTAIYSMQKGWFETYGFKNPNGLGMFGFHLAVCCFILLKKYNTLIAFTIVFIIIQIFYALSSSRTAWLGGIVFCLCILLYKLKVFNKRTKILIAVLPAIFTVIDYYLILNYNSFWGIDVLVSGRLSIPGKILTQMSRIHWLIGFTMEKGVPLDGSLVLLLRSGGIYAITIFCILFYRAFAHHFDHVKRHLPLILGILACGLSENTFADCTGLSVIFWSLILDTQSSKQLKL